MNKRIALFSYFTNKYNNYIPLWLETTAKNFYPENSDVFILTEKPENKKYETDRIKVMIIDKDDPNIKQSEYFLENKLKYNLDFVKNYGKDYEYIANLLSNIALFKKITIDTNPLPVDKIILQMHADPATGSDPSIFNNSILQTMSEYYIHAVFYNYYILACMFLGPYREVYDMLQSCISMEERDSKLIKQGKYKYRQISPWYDETYINRWCIDNTDKIIVEDNLQAENLPKKKNNPLYIVRDKNKLDKQFYN